MDSEYKRLSSVDEFINPNGVCIVCKNDGLHVECERKFRDKRKDRNESIRRNELAVKEIESKFLKKYSLVKGYGVKNKQRFNEAKKKVRELFSEDHSYRIENELESAEWFFVPYYFIGCLGYIVVKDTFSVFPVGSAYGYVWKGVEAFESGLLNESGS